MEEMLQQPAALVTLHNLYKTSTAIPRKRLRELVSTWPPTVVFTGMASSLFAAYPAQVFLSSLGIRALVWETADLLHYHLKFLGKDTLLVIVSQSGESVEIKKLVDAVPKHVGMVAVVNAEDSFLAKTVKFTLPMKAGTQTSVSTKTYNSSVALLMYLAFAIAEELLEPLNRAVCRAAQIQSRLIEQREAFLPQMLGLFDRPGAIMVLSRGPDLSTVYEGALYFKEVARLPAEPMSAGQFRHGPLETIDPGRVFIVIARRGKTAKLLLKLADFISSNRGKVLLLSDIPLHSNSICNVKVGSVALGLGTLVDSLYLQFLTHELALRAGLDSGHFWIHSSVVRVE